VRQPALHPRPATQCDQRKHANSGDRGGAAEVEVWRFVIGDS